MPRAKKNSPKQANGYSIIHAWLGSKGLRAFPFQVQTWEAHCAGKSGLVNAPTGFGKTFAVFLAVMVDWINRHPDDYLKLKNNGLQLLWITPLRALAKDISRAMTIALEELHIPWRVGVRNGDTSLGDRQKQQRSAPEILLITPESLHLLIGAKNHEETFKTLTCIAIDEWHELLGTKRGVQVELGIAHLKTLRNSDCGLRNGVAVNKEEFKEDLIPLNASNKGNPESEIRKPELQNGVAVNREGFKEDLIPLNASNKGNPESEIRNPELQNGVAVNREGFKEELIPLNASNKGNPESEIRNPESIDPECLRIWSISATIGNLAEAAQVALGDWEAPVIIRAHLEKKIAINTILPDTVERFPWAGHLGIKMIHHVLPVIYNSRTTLLFTNVRSAAEMWYQALLAAAPDLAGAMALHHSAIDGELRTWVEEQLHEGTLKVVVCTASLDLGVDFRPVDTVIQVGSPKGVARFLQRAGRSGHQPDAVSNIWFVPTHSLEIIEAIALQQAYEKGLVESRNPVLMAWDVLIQYLVTRAVGDGFKSIELYAEVLSTHSYADVTWDEWEWLLAFITKGGNTLTGYEEYHKVVLGEDGVYRVPNKRIAMRHRMNIGTIVGDALMRVKFLGGGFVGTIEENFISRLKPGDAFILAGRRLELVGVKDMDAMVKKSTAKNAQVPAWNIDAEWMAGASGARQTTGTCSSLPAERPCRIRSRHKSCRLHAPSYILCFS